MTDKPREGACIFSNTIKFKMSSEIFFARVLSASESDDVTKRLFGSYGAMSSVLAYLPPLEMLVLQALSKWMY